MTDTQDSVLAGGGRTLAGRYELERVLKEGGGVTTALATDRETGAEVVVKIVGASAVSAGARMRLEHEAEVLRRLDSPRLASILEVGVDDDVLFLVMPRVPGLALDRLLAEQRPMPVAEAAAFGAKLFSALAEAHACGIVHRDVKPANVLVGPGPRHDVTLIDFGLARSGWLAQSLRDLPVGTARYVAPEQAGLLHVPVDERADLYSGGAVLFEAVAGRPPFEGATVGEVLRAHASTPAPRLRGLGLDVPAALDEIVQRLLRKDPRDRYQTAAGVVADLEQLRAGLAGGNPDPPVVIGVHDERHTLTEPAFVGRTRELAVLDGEVDAAAAGDGALILVEAESGGGKSRVLDELEHRAAAAGAWVLRGQGLDQAATRPFQMLTSVAEEIVAAAGAEPGIVERIRGSFGQDADDIRAALPALGQLLPDTGSRLGPEQHAPARVSAALSGLFDALGHQGRPAVVLLDDCQWADEPTLHLLGRWVSAAPEAAGRHTTVVAAFRSDEVGPESPLRRTGARRTIVLPPFADADVRGLVESMAGPLPNRAVEVVETLAGGSPFMASAVLRGLVEVGALVREGRGWEIDDAAIADVQSSRRAAAFLTQRLRLLPDPARRLLTIGAVLGKEFDLELAADLAGQSGREAVGAVNEAHRRNIVWFARTGAGCVFVHDKLREALLADVGADELAALHLGAAERLERLEPAPVFELGYHFDAAGAHGRALPYALAAGDEARRRHALDLAERQYRIARRGASETPDPDAVYRAAHGLGEVLLLQGRYADAEAEFLGAREVAHDDARRAEVARQLGEVAFRRGDVAEAGRFLEQALRLMGRHPPRRRAIFFVLLVWEVLVQVGHTVFPRRLGRKDPSTARGRADLAAARAYSRMAYTFWFARGRIPCAWVHLRGMNLVERYPPGPELAQAWSEHAPVMTMIPYHTRAIAYAEKSFAIRERLGDVWGQGQSLSFHGVALYSASRYEECIDKCRRAVRLLQRTGDQWEVNTATWNIAFAQYRLGRLQQAIATAQRVHGSGSAIGDHQAAGIGLGAWAKAAAGDLPADIVAAALARERDDVHTSAEVLSADALRLMAAGDPGAAVARLEEADKLVRASGLRQEYVSPVVAWLTTARRLQIEALGPWHPRQRRRIAREAARTSRRARRTARFYRNNAPHAWREAGYLYALSGRTRRARACFDRALAVAEGQSARYERALTLEARGRVGLAAGWAGAEDDLSEAAAELAAMRGTADTPEPQPTLSLADRFERLLDEGRNIAAALTPDAVHEALRAAAEALLRPQGVRVLDVAAAWDDALASSGGSEDPFVSRSLVERAMRTARPASSAGDLGADAGESMLLAAARSAMAAPVFVRGRPAACLYVTHDEVGGLYGDDDERIAQFLTSIAGAALENAEGFASVQALTRSLEQRVAERTADLATANRELDRSLAELRVAFEREQEVAERLRTLDTLKNEFVAMVAHDLRSPMATISQAAKTLVYSWDALTQSDREHLLDMIVRSTNGLSGLVEDVLQVARIESGQFSYELAEFDLAALVQRTVREIVVGVTNEIVVEAAEDLPPAYGDVERNWQVLMNLLSNAAKFSAEGTPIHVTVAGDGDMLRVSVADRGAGIAAEDMPRLFQKFSRIRAADVRGKVKGTGLGLYICQCIVEAQGGRIWAQSRLGEGSTFSYTVPAAGGAAGR